MCGVFGIRSPGRDVARLTYFGLHALQHRGQESAGIAATDRGHLTVLRDMGLVTQVFNQQKLRGLVGDAAIGHTRYSTTGASQWANAQPLVHHGQARTIALGHNGNLVNAEELRDELREDGVPLASSSDSETIAALIAADGKPRRPSRARWSASRAPTPSSPSPRSLVAFRDPQGFRPLCLGRLEGDWVVASEDVRARPARRRDRAGGAARRADPRRRRAAQRAGDRADPRGRVLHLRVLLSRTARHAPRRGGGARRQGANGERLAAEAPVDADFVLPIPDSGTPAAIGFARASGIPYSEGVTKNRYVGRTFIQPEQGMREQGIKMKYNPLDAVAGKPRPRGRLARPWQHDAAARRDDVRGRSGRGARPHLVAARDRHVLLRHRPRRRGRARRAGRSVEEVREHIGATSLAYSPSKGSRRRRDARSTRSAAPASTRDYPTRVPQRAAKPGSSRRAPSWSVL